MPQPSLKQKSTPITNIMQPPNSRAATRIALLGMVSLLSISVMTGCQTPASMGTPTTTPVLHDIQTPNRLQAFNIRGKIGVIVPQNIEPHAQSGSAFYVWAQDDDRFAIDLTGALGIGHTVIEYNGQTATLVSDKTGTITATSPEELLQQATGWQAPISQLPYWISGSPAPSDSDINFNNNQQLTSATNGEWVASFEYKDTQQVGKNLRQLPSTITVQKQDGHKVVMTINHDS
ncbi:lipoprotein insertase outer membrane protein LolB [Psychrobacter sp. I-STPA10]|uniref:lipoprotein insertase outer membrane protein LolB n=1 Tax=Psychrobacter sp. I-STPA10 TaxID=2585769 RepID=UPI001E565AAD|nr:lipoprotein insertase outer membrane protein LolB [Psychrobacter sp. I-STPA10]